MFAELVGRVELIFENLAEHDALVKLLNLQAFIFQFVLYDAAIHLLNVAQGAYSLYKIVFRD